MKTPNQANEHETIEYKPRTTKQLAHLYEISPRVFNTWIRPFLHEIGKREGHFYKAIQVKIIIDRLGPYRIKDM